LFRLQLVAAFVRQSLPEEKRRQVAALQNHSFGIVASPSLNPPQSEGKKKQVREADD
jgi:hypothetical protein